MVKLVVSKNPYSSEKLVLELSCISNMDGYSSFYFLVTMKLVQLGLLLAR